MDEISRMRMDDGKPDDVRLRVISRINKLTDSSRVQQGCSLAANTHNAWLMLLLS